MTRIPFVTSAALCLSLAAMAADDPRQRQDLAAVIAQGKPCGEVVSYTVQGENDFLATCKDGNRYRVYVTNGRVVVDISATITDALVAEVQRLGGVVINQHSRFNAMRVRMPLAQL